MSSLPPPATELEKRLQASGNWDWNPDTVFDLAYSGYGTAVPVDNRTRLTSAPPTPQPAGDMSRMLWLAAGVAIVLLILK